MTILSLSTLAAPVEVATPVDRRCQRCGWFAELFDIDGAWCNPTCRRLDAEAPHHTPDGSPLRLGTATGGGVWFDERHNCWAATCPACLGWWSDYGRADDADLELRVHQADACPVRRDGATS